MSFLSKFQNIPIVKRAANVYNTFIGSNEAATTPQGTPAKTGETHPLVGFSDPSPSQHQVNFSYNTPQQRVRKNIELDVMIALNVELKTALKNLAYDAAGTFQGIRVVSAVNKPLTQKVVDDFVKRTKLKRYLAEIFRRCLLYGNGFPQHEIKRISNTKAQINQLFWMPVYGMIRCSNELDQFENVDEAYQLPDLSLGVWQKNSNVKLPVWAINHIRFFNLPGEPYGFSLFESNLASKTSQQLVDLLVELYWQRKYSTVTDIHLLQGPENRPANDELLRNHESKISKLRRIILGQAPLRDLVMATGSVNRLPSDANTDKTKDIELRAAISLAEAHQSRQMISDDQFANVGVLVEKYRQFYNRQETHLQMMIGELDESVQFELALNGIDPGDVELEYQVAQTFLFQDLVVANQEARNDLDKGYITKDTKIKIGSMLYRVSAKSETEKLAQEQKAKEITEQNQSDDVRRVVENKLEKTDIQSRPVALTEVDPIESQQIN